MEPGESGIMTVFAWKNIKEEQSKGRRETKMGRTLELLQKSGGVSYESPRNASDGAGGKGM